MIVEKIGLEPIPSESESEILTIIRFLNLVAPPGLEPDSSVSKTDIINPYTMEQFC
jgi:hypothetical protein